MTNSTYCRLNAVCYALNLFVEDQKPWDRSPYLNRNLYFQYSIDFQHEFLGSGKRLKHVKTVCV